MSPRRAPNGSTSRCALARRGFEVLDFDAIADAMWRCACSGVSMNAIGDFDTAYLRRCSRRVGSTALVFTRDETEVAACRFRSPALQRSWHLSIACRDRFERDTWLWAFFGEHRHRLWATGAATASGRAFTASHWRLFCDANWLPAELDREPAELRAAGYLAASEVGLRPLAGA